MGSQVEKGESQVGFYFLPYHLNHYGWEIWTTRVKYLFGYHQGSQVGSRVGSQMESQVGLWNGIPSGIPGGIARIPGGNLTLQIISIYVWFTKGSQAGLESQLGSRLGFQKQALARISKVGSKVKSRVVYKKVNI